MTPSNCREQYYTSLQKALSAERLDSYRINSDPSEFKAIARYFYNAALCEALYPALHALEVGLRNSLDQAITEHCRTNWPNLRDWLSATSPVLCTPQRQDVSAARQRLRQSGKTQINHSSLVGQLSFGFWTGILGRSYEVGGSASANIWPRLLKKSFPHISPQRRTRNNIPFILTRVRRLRNRAFHHEPIWHFSDLLEQYEVTTEAIGWVCPNLRDTIYNFDKFPHVYASGVDAYRVTR